MALNSYRTLIMLAGLLTVSHAASAAALDDIKLEVSHDLCEEAGANDRNFIVFATNLNSSQAIDAQFKYDSSPGRQHFVLFDVSLNPMTDRFPKLHVRRLQPHETARIGCAFTYRAAPEAPGPLSVPLAITIQSAAYVDSAAAEAPAEDARSFAAFILQGGIKECAAGAKPPGLFYLVNLHPYAQLSASINLLDDHGNRIGALIPKLSPLSAARVACSNGSPKPGPIISAALLVSAGDAAALRPASPPQQAPSSEAPTPVPLILGAIMHTQNVCTGSVPAGWIKTNDAWNPTVCGNPARIVYNVWSVQQLSDQPVGAVIYACKGTIPAGWTIVGAAWNPTLCGHPGTNQLNVMAIRRLN